MDEEVDGEEDGKEVLIATSKAATAKTRAIPKRNAA